MDEVSLPDRVSDPDEDQTSRHLEGSSEPRPRFVVAIDRSPEADAALREAVSLARRVGASLVLLHVAVAVGSTFDGPRRWARANDAARTAGEELIEDAWWQAADVVVQSELRFGNPAREICQLAGELEAALVVLGSRRRTWLDRLLVGSVSVAVAARAPCSVLVVRGAGAEGKGAPSAAFSGYLDRPGQS
jgi:nucleotide-binding universal stress UspA family protein